MGTVSPKVWRLIGVLVFVFVLSGCTLGERLKTRRTIEQPSVRQNQPSISSVTLTSSATGSDHSINQPTSPAATLSSQLPSAFPENIVAITEEITATTTVAVSSGTSNDTQADDLLNMINALDAANQAGDPLDNLP